MRINKKYFETLENDIETAKEELKKVVLEMTVKTAVEKINASNIKGAKASKQSVSDFVHGKTVSAKWIIKMGKALFYEKKQSTQKKVLD